MFAKINPSWFCKNWALGHTNCEFLMYFFFQLMRAGGFFIFIFFEKNILMREGVFSKKYIMRGGGGFFLPYGKPQKATKFSRLSYIGFSVLSKFTWSNMVQYPLCISLFNMAQREPRVYRLIALGDAVTL